MGDIVHRPLEKLYKDRKFKKLVSKVALLKFYKEIWKKKYLKRKLKRIRVEYPRHHKK